MKSTKIIVKGATNVDVKVKGSCNAKVTKKNGGGSSMKKPTLTTNLVFTQTGCPPIVVSVKSKKLAKNHCVFGRLKNASKFNIANSSGKSQGSVNRKVELNTKGNLLKFKFTTSSGAKAIYFMAKTPTGYACTPSCCKGPNQISNIFKRGGALTRDKCVYGGKPGKCTFGGGLSSLVKNTVSSLANKIPSSSITSDIKSIAQNAFNAALGPLLSASQSQLPGVANKLLQTFPALLKVGLSNLDIANLVKQGIQSAGSTQVPLILNALKSTAQNLGAPWTSIISLINL